MTRFGIIGAAGFVAPRHMRAIHDVGGDLVLAYDPYDGVGILDRHFPNCSFTTSEADFARRAQETELDWVAVTSPNYLHRYHTVMAMQAGANVICEKPVAIYPRDVDIMRDWQEQLDRQINVVLQLRLHPQAEAIRNQPRTERAEVVLTYITRRGPWFHESWKGDLSKSGGLALNIGVHFFDLMLWLFGAVHRSVVHLRTDTRCAGVLELEQARVRWFLSVDAADLPPGAAYAHRTLTVDGAEVDLSAGFEDAHTRVYREVLAGRGFGVMDARRAVEVATGLYRSDLTTSREGAHPLVDSP